MPNEYSTDDKIILRSTDGTQMSLPAFFKLALRDGSGNFARPTSWRGHNAWDMGVAGATTVPAITPVFGTVSGCAQTGNNGGMGTYVIIEDEKGRSHRFMHMIENSLVVSSGDSVSQGDKLGIIGNTGDSQGAHLHYDVTVNGERINDPIDAFDCSTLPSGWNFGDAVDHDGDWDYIPLDNPPDYGPPGGDTPSEPYYPTKPCHDIAHPQVSGGSLNPCIDAIADAGDAGVIIQVGSIRRDGFRVDNDFDPAEAVQKVFDRGLGLGIYFYNYADYDTDQTQAFQDALSYLETIGATKEKVNLGVWLDTEYTKDLGYDPVPSTDQSVNYSYVERFMNVFDSAGYPVVGVYSSASNFEPWYGSDKIGDKPIWAAYYTGTFDTVDRSSLESYLPESTYTNVYMMQYSSSGSVPGWSGTLDCVKVLTPMPTVGSGGGSGGGGGGEVIKVTVDIVPPKRIYFNPTPGLLDAATDLLSDRKATITLTTDADNAELYYTVDGSSPYQYTYVEDNLAYIVASKAQLYSSSITIHKDSHIRVVAVPSGTGIGGSFTEPLAKGSATYLFKYQGLEQSWEDEQKSYAISEGDISFFEENKQAFLRLHAEQTEEEILYATVYKHDTQVVVEDAKDSASSFTGTKPDDERENADSDSDSDTPVNPKPDTEESEGD